MLTTAYRRARLLGFALTLAMFGSFVLWCQEPAPQLSARDLFYRQAAPAQSKRPAVPPAKKPSAPTQTATAQKPPVAPAAPQSTGEEKVANGALLEKISAVAKEPEVTHLGLRYSMLLVDKTTGNAKPVSANQTFDEGECLSLDIQSNRSGYLYVFNLGSSGAWKPLLPTKEMPDEGNFVEGLTPVRIPATHCFRITGPPGSERLFVVLSRNPQDVNELNQSIKNQAGTKTDNPPAAAPGAALTTMAQNLNEVVQKLANLKSRDLEVEEVAAVQNSAANDPAVYVVHTSDTPSDKVVTEIDIKHQ